MCGSDLNNCEEGFSCAWDGQDNDVGICESTYGNAIMTDISISDYNAKMTLRF